MDLLSPGLEPPPITRFDIENAADRITGYIRHTPVARLEPGAFGVPGIVTLKLELLQHTGSFKPRGAFSRMLSAELDDSGVLAASGGNFGLGVAYAAHVLGHRAEIFVPETSPPVKIERIRALGAEVHVIPGYYADAYAACEERAFDSGAAFMHPYDQEAVVAGQGTIGAELEMQAPDLETVLVAVGGGGLIGGIAAWFAGEVRVVGVEPEACPTLHAALDAGEPVDVEVGGVASDSLGAMRVGRIGYDIARRFVDHVVLVPDDAIAEAQRRLWNECHVLAEPGGAVALAALLRGSYVPRADERVVVLVCGGNTDPASVS
ncbi:MAG: threonine/serine dehydratase [Solirubrobacterales bacterium]|jgi:threonine dehydratase